MKHFKTHFKTVVLISLFIQGSTSTAKDRSSSQVKKPLQSNLQGRDLKGQISGTLKRSLSPYTVTGDLLVRERLEIEAGVQLVFKGKYKFEIIGGDLIVAGSSDQKVIFRAENPSEGWWGIKVCPNSQCFTEGPAVGTIDLNHLVIQDSKKDDTNPNDRYWRRGGALMVYKAKTVQIMNSEFKGNYALERGGAIEIMSSRAFIGLSQFYQNTAGDGGGAIRLTHASGSIISESNFIQNKSLSNGGAISIYDSNASIENSSFQANQAVTGGAIQCFGGQLTQRSNRFKQNIPDQIRDCP